ncbi:MAG: NPCBM/NEW2 domain-containing protein [Kiritimatiellia bacterium]
MKNHPDAPKASVVFQVMGDGQVLFDSGIMRIGDLPGPRGEGGCQGCPELTLVVTDAGDGNSCDHADWGEPVLTRGSVSRAKSPVFRVTAPALTLMLDEDGRIASTTGLDVSGRAGLRECRTVSRNPQREMSGGGRSFERQVADRQGHGATITERFIPDGDGIRWEWKSPAPTRSGRRPSRSGCRRPVRGMTSSETAWGSPDYSGTQLTPNWPPWCRREKASVSGPWNDPLTPVGFVNRTWHYGNVSQACPVGADYTVPLCAILAPRPDTGLSLVLSRKMSCWTLISA